MEEFNLDISALKQEESANSGKAGGRPVTVPSYHLRARGEDKFGMTKFGMEFTGVASWEKGLGLFGKVGSHVVVACMPVEKANTLKSMKIINQAQEDGTNLEEKDKGKNFTSDKLHSALVAAEILPKEFNVKENGNPEPIDLMFVETGKTDKNGNPLFVVVKTDREVVKAQYRTAKNLTVSADEQDEEDDDSSQDDVSDFQSSNKSSIDSDPEDFDESSTDDDESSNDEEEDDDDNAFDGI